MGQIRKILEDFYYGNLTPSKKELQPGSKLQRAVNTAARCESQFAKELDEVKQALLTKLVNRSNPAESGR